MSTNQAAEGAARDPVDNTLRMYRAMDTSMMAAHRRRDLESRAEGERIARILLSNADLPLVLRCRACMILGCSNEGDYVGFAEEAVRIAELAISVASRIGQVERDLLISAQDWLYGAQEAFEAARDEEEDEDEEDEEQPIEEQDGGTYRLKLPNGIEIIWESDSAQQETGAGVGAEQVGDGVEAIWGGDVDEAGEDGTTETETEAFGNGVSTGSAPEPEV